MEDSSSRLLSDYASSKVLEAVAHAALHDAIKDILAAPVTKTAPRYVRLSLEVVRCACQSVVMATHWAAPDGPLSADVIEWEICTAAIAEYGYFAAVTRWRGEWLVHLRHCAAGTVVVSSPPVPNPTEFLAVCGEALEEAFLVEPWEAIPDHVMGAIKELSRGYLEVGQSLSAISVARGQSSFESLAIAAKVLANMSETEAMTMGVLIAWRLCWLYKWRRVNADRAARASEAP